MKETKDRWLSVNDVAYRLGMTTQGVRDLCRRELLVYKRSKDDGNCLILISEKGLDKYIASMKQVGQVEDLDAVLQEKKRQLKKEIKRNEELLQETRNSWAFLTGKSYIYRMLLNKGVESFYRAFSFLMPKREQEVIEYALNNTSLDEIAKKYGVTTMRCRQLVNLAHRRIYVTIHDVEYYKRENNMLEAENTRLKEIVEDNEAYINELKNLLEKADNNTGGVLPVIPEWYRKAGSCMADTYFRKGEYSHFYSCNTNRLRTYCLENGIETMLDLIYYDANQVMKYRHYGRRTMKDMLETKREFMEHYGITDEEIENVRFYYNAKNDNTGTDTGRKAVDK